MRLGMHLTIDSAGSAVNLQTQNGASVNEAVRQYLLDARGVEATLAALQLTWPDSAPEYAGRMSIETSDDLATWHLQVAAAPHCAPNGSPVKSRSCPKGTLRFYWPMAVPRPPARRAT